MQIRPFRPGDERALYEVFYSSVHGLASRDYTSEQIHAWAPASFDQDVWAKRVQGIRPFVAEHDGALLAYADVQSDGYIDHFFVSADHAGRGVGRLLMEHLHAVAKEWSIAVLSSDVSRTAQPFFAKFGFVVTEQKAAAIRGVVVPNAHMRKALASVPSLGRTACGFPPSAPGHVGR